MNEQAPTPEENEAAAQRDREYAKAMTPDAPPLFAFIKGPQPEARSTVRIEIVTYAGIVLGTGTLRRGGKRENQMYVTADIGGRTFWGKTPTFNGTYVRLRPYRHERKTS